MVSKLMHAWSLLPAEAIAFQKKLAMQICACGVVKNARLIAGVKFLYRMEAALAE